MSGETKPSATATAEAKPSAVHHGHASRFVPVGAVTVVAPGGEPVSPANVKLPAGVAPREFSAKAKERIAWLFTRYPVKEAALLPILRVAEEEFDGIGPAEIVAVAKTVGLSPAYVLGVLTFYSHFKRQGEGKYVVQVCSTISCALRGCRDIVHHLEGKLGITPGTTTADRRFTLKKVECLGSCDTGPVVQINDDYHENLTIEALDKIIAGLP